MSEPGAETGGAEEAADTAGRLFSKRDLAGLIWPLAADQALAIAVGLADSMMVSGVSEAAVSAVSLVDTISVLLISTFSAFATGGAVVTSRFLGAGDEEGARASVDQLFWVTAVLSLAVSGVLLAAHRPLLALLFPGVEAGVMKDCEIYFTITALSYPCIALCNAPAASFRAGGNTRVSLWTGALINFVNLAGNGILIYGLGMGVAGAALPTLASRALGAGVTLYLLRREKGPVRLSPVMSIRPAGPLIRGILHISLPNAAEHGMFHLGKILVTRMLAGLGTAQIAANAMSNHIADFCYLGGQAVNLAIVTVVGRCVGARDPRQARRYTLALMGVSQAVNALSSGIIWLSLPLLLRYYHASPETAGYVRTIVSLHCICVPLLWSWSFTLPGALRAADDARFTSLVSIVSMWIFRVGFSELLGLRLGWGVVGIWCAMFLDWAIRGILFAVRFFRGKNPAFAERVSGEAR